MASQSGQDLRRTRDLGRKPWRLVGKALAIGASLVALAYILDIALYFDVTLFREQFFGLLYALVLAGAYLLYPATKRSPRDRVPVYDLILAAAGLLVGGYIFVAWPAVVAAMVGTLTPEKVILGGVAVLLILEATRRLYGWPIVILASVFILYAHFQYLLPGALGGRGYGWDRLAAHLYTDKSAILGLIAAVVFGMVFGFILFGRALFATGGGEFLTQLSLALMGRRRGGPAKVAVVASGLFGMLSGSTSSNVVITGSLTIPMMKNTGYRGSIAAAVESVASSGGSLMPPIMGATAFIMAEMIEAPYRDIALAAALPALLYYASLFIQVDLEAAKAGLKGLAAGELPALRPVLTNGWVFCLPLAVLVYCLFVIFVSPAKSALIAFAVLIAVSLAAGLLVPGRRISLRVLFVDTLEDTGRLLIEIGVIGAVAGLIVGIVSLTGLGLVFSEILTSLSGGNLFLLLLLTAAASILLGMSMPVTASYVILAVLAAPALVDAGVSPMAAHLFVFYFAIMSFITPPVCVAIYIAAAIAGAKPMETAVHGMKMGIVAYVVPFVFVTDEALLLAGSTADILFTAVSVVIGVVGLAVAIQGHLGVRIARPIRGLIFVGAGLALIDPAACKLGGMALVAATLYWQWRVAPRRARAGSAA